MARTKRGSNTDAIVSRPGRALRRVIFPGLVVPLSSRELRFALEPIVARWLEATCVWSRPRVGEHRTLTFWAAPSETMALNIRIDSNPAELPLCQIAAGHDDGRLQSEGFAPAADGHTYQRLLDVRTASEIPLLAAKVVTWLDTVFGYRGVQPLCAMLEHEIRTRRADVFDTFTPRDVAKAFTLNGYATEVDDTDPAGATIHCRREGLTTLACLGERIGCGCEYGAVEFRADFELTGAEAEEASRTLGPGIPMVQLSVAHQFTGGVTLTWLMQRIREWEDLTREQQRRVQPPPRRRSGRLKIVRRDSVH